MTLIFIMVNGIVNEIIKYNNTVINQKVSRDSYKGSY